MKNVIESAPGVGQVTIAGAADRAVQVNIDARRLAAYELSILQVRDALARQNAEVPGGRVDDGLRELSLRTLGRVPHAREFPDLVVATVDGTAVRVCATWARSATPPRKSARWPASTASRPSCCRCSGSRARTRST